MAIFNSFNNEDLLFKKRRGETTTNVGLDTKNTLSAVTYKVAEQNLNFEHDYFFEITEINPFFVGLQVVQENTNIDPSFYLINGKIGNRTGETQNYSWYMYNATKGVILDTQENISVDNKTLLNAQYIVKEGDVEEGDVIYFYLFAGKLGTEQQEPIFGQVGIDLLTMTYPSEVEDYLN
ncbi:MAG: hypothetical protein ACOC5T_08690 [Elusimicrobiota bacterium]